MKINLENRLQIVYLCDMQKVTFVCKTDRAVKDALFKQAAELEITPSVLGHTILKKHISKQEGKPAGKKEYK